MQILSAYSKETVNLTQKSKTTIVKFLWNLGTHFKITSIEELSQRVLEYSEMNGLNINIKEVPFFLIYRMYQENIFTGVLIPQKMGLAADTFGYTRKLKEVVLKLFQIQERNPEANLDLFFRDVSKRYLNIQSKKDRDEILKGAISHRDATDNIMPLTDEEQEELKEKAEELLNESFYTSVLQSSSIIGKKRINSVGKFKKLTGTIFHEGDILTIFRKNIENHKRLFNNSFYDKFKRECNLINTRDLHLVSIVISDDSLIYPANILSGTTFDEIAEAFLNKKNLNQEDKDKNEVIKTIEKYYEYNEDGEFVVKDKFVDNNELCRLSKICCFIESFRTPCLVSRKEKIYKDFIISFNGVDINLSKKYK